jgi:hypothetical protein
LAKILQKCPAELISAELKENENFSTWSWRLSYVGMQVTLYIMESEQKHKGEKFIYLFGNDGRYFKTSCGEIEWEDDVLTIKTKRSVYRFRKMK